MEKIFLFSLLFALFLLTGCGNKIGTCTDVTSIDGNWKNDMKCTKLDGSVFYTDYDGAKKFETNKSEGTSDNYEDNAYDSCNIKGNISYNGGKKIYHIPGCASYDATVINTSYGERWFCSEQEAVSAGWRKAYNCP